MLSARSSIVAVRDTVFSDLGGEIAVLSMRSGEYFGLNEVGAFVWSLIQARTTFDELCRAVEHEYDVAAERCRRDLAELIGELHANELVEIAEAT